MISVSRSSCKRASQLLWTWPPHRLRRSLCTTPVPSMPLIDKPLPELLRLRQARNPCPPDFDAYWNRALREMEAVDPRVELRPAAFQSPRAECFDLFFTGVGGARVHAKYVRPKALRRRAPGRAAVPRLHRRTAGIGATSSSSQRARHAPSRRSIAAARAARARTRAACWATRSTGTSSAVSTTPTRAQTRLPANLSGHRATRQDRRRVPRGGRGAHRRGWAAARAAR